MKISTLPNNKVALAVQFTLILIAGTWFTHSEAAIYKQVDEQGNITYSDVATKKDEAPVSLPKVMTFKPLVTPQQIQQIRSNNEPVKGEPDNSPTGSRYSSLQIDQPSNDQAIRANGGIFPVQLTSNPTLNANAKHRYVVLVDGKVHQSSTIPGFEITNIARGTHTLTAQIHDDSGKILANSSTITVHVLRVSILRP
ncbi:MAG: DUF4124 domain-containing protein [Gammaproteobacteria bacterium]|nr:DUF4124 domain-containing protein [Gammaproteobacteria bacterium]